MNNDNRKIKVDGGWFLYALSLLFIALKLMGYIDWSWFWVLAPLWIQAVIVIITIIVVIKREIRKIKNA